MTIATTRSDVLKITALASAGTLLGGRPGQAATTITIMQENSFIKAYDEHNAPLWTREPRNLPYREPLATSRLLGWPEPVGRKSTEAVAKYVVVDMFAQACAGKSTKDVIAEAKAKLTQIYG